VESLQLQTSESVTVMTDWEVSTDACNSAVNAATCCRNSSTTPSLSAITRSLLASSCSRRSISALHLTSSVSLSFNFLRSTYEHKKISNQNLNQWFRVDLWPSAAASQAALPAPRLYPSTFQMTFSETLTNADALIIININYYKIILKILYI